MNFFEKAAATLTLAAGLFAGAAANADDLFSPNNPGNNNAGNRPSQGVECRGGNFGREGRALVKALIEVAPQNWNTEIIVSLRSKTTCEREALKNAVGKEIERTANNAKRALSLVEDIAAGQENARKPLAHAVQDPDLRGIMSVYYIHLKGQAQGLDKEQTIKQIDAWSSQKKGVLDEAIQNAGSPEKKPVPTGPAMNV